MTRAMLVLVALAAVAPAAAAKPMMIRRVWNQCASAPAWDKLKTCLAHFGRVTVVRTLDRTKVVRVGEDGSDDPDPGIYLYTESGRSLQLVGSWEFTDGASVELFDVARVAIRGRTGFRLDLGSVEPSSVMLDDNTVLVATMQRRTAVYCVGAGSYCSGIVESCDVFVGGKAYYTFRGALALRGGTVTVTGDTSLAGTCSPIERSEIVGDGLPPP